MATGADLVRQARQYLGVAYAHCGRDEHGLDCSGLILRVAHDLGLTTWDEVDYSHQVDADYMHNNLLRFCDELPREQWASVRPGDILWFAPVNHPQHLGMLTLPGYFIHSHQMVSKVVETGLDNGWKRRLRGVFRWRGLAREEERSVCQSELATGEDN